jgi:hypothetical protein
MESELLKSLIPYGPFALLFVVLFWYVLKDQAKRETQATDREKVFMDFIREIMPVMQKLDDHVLNNSAALARLECSQTTLLTSVAAVAAAAAVEAHRMARLQEKEYASTH